MRTLKGDVDVLGLGNLLQALSMHGREGILTISRGTNKKTIHFSPKGMRLQSTTMKRINKIGNILLKKKKISPEDLKALLAEQRLLGWKFGHLAVDSGKVTKRDLEEALREQVQDEIYDMFLWTDAAFEFIQGPPRQAAENPLSELTYEANIASLILEAAYHADEILTLRKMFDTDGVILVRTGKAIPAEIPGDDIEAVHGIYPLITGKRTIRDIEHDSIYPRTATLRALNALITHGCIKRAGKVAASGTEVRVNPARG